MHQVYETSKNLAAQVSHDLRSPLAALKALSNERDGLSNDQLALLNAAINRLNSIAQQLNSLAYNQESSSLELHDLQIQSDSEIVVLDDDEAIHLMWKARLGSYVRKGLIKELVHFSSVQDFRHWFIQSENGTARRTYLIDFELDSTASSTESGLDVIQSLSLSENAVLVTSRSDDPGVIERCQSLGVKLLSKGESARIPIEVR